MKLMRRRSRPRCDRSTLVAAATAVVLIVAAGACGNRGSPRPPLPKIPETPADVKWRQRGTVLQVRAQYRLDALGGRGLTPPVRPVVLVGRGAASKSLDGRQFAQQSERIDLPPFGAFTAGDRLARIDLVDVSGWSDEPVVLGLAMADARQVSRASPRVSYEPSVEPPEPVSDLTVEPQESGVLIVWSAPSDERVKSVLIYRSLDGEPNDWSVWKAIPVDETETFDDSVVYGQRVAYVATTTSGGGEILVESEPVDPIALDYVDTFPPARPEDLEAVAENDAVRLIWWAGNSDEERDVAVERQREGQESFVRVASVAAPDFSYRDENVEAGTRYRYRVYAVDAAGNRSSMTEPTDWIAPRSRQERSP